MVIVWASAEEWRARLGIWIYSFSMDREVPKRFSKSAIDSSVRTGHLLEYMMGKESKASLALGYSRLLEGFFSLKGEQPPWKEDTKVKKGSLTLVRGHLP